MDASIDPVSNTPELDRLELLTVSEVCAILRCHEKTLYQWVKRGSLTAIRIGSKLKFDPADVASFIRCRRTVAHIRIRHCGTL